MGVKYFRLGMEQDLAKRFTYHPPITKSQVIRYEEIREYAKNFARVIDQRCPDSRELSLAYTKIEEAVFWANAAIARNEVESEPKT